jgi:hypothetical protein
MPNVGEAGGAIRPLDTSQDGGDMGNVGPTTPNEDSSIMEFLAFLMANVIEA